MNGDDLLFEACGVLDSSGIEYWICHGTLLGIIREARLLPWDHDIDIAVWSDVSSPDEIKSLFLAQGYMLEDIDPANQCLHFIKKNTSYKVDINFYTRESGHSAVRWLVRKPGILNALRYKVLEGLSGEVFKYSSTGNIGRIVAYLFWGLGNFFSVILPHDLIKLLKHLLQQGLFSLIGYSYPNEVMETTSFQYKNRFIRIPKYYEKVLCLTYGNDWMVPKQSYTWHVDAKNLK